MTMNCAARDTGGTLEVEDDEARMDRIHNTLNKLSSSAPSPFPTPKFDFGERTTYEVQPNTELLSRLHAFLPQLEASNALLQSQDPHAYNIELAPSSDPEQYIEMNLGLGVFESKSKPDGSNNAMDVESPSPDSHSSDTTSSDSTSSDSTSSSSSSDSETPSHEPEEYIPLSTFIRDISKPKPYSYDSDESDDDYDVEIVNTAFVPLPRKIKPLPKRAGKGGKGIVVIGEEGK